MLVGFRAPPRRRCRVARMFRPDIGVSRHLQYQLQAWDPAHRVERTQKVGQHHDISKNGARRRRF
jgi:hypothetical protein